jgi:hypothetical protein
MSGAQRYMSVSQAAAYLGVTETALRVRKHRGVRDPDRDMRARWVAPAPRHGFGAGVPGPVHRDSAITSVGRAPVSRNAKTSSEQTPAAQAVQETADSITLSERATRLVDERAKRERWSRSDVVEFCVLLVLVGEPPVASWRSPLRDSD